MLLTVGAQLVETVVVRGVVYAAELGARTLYWVGSTTIGYLWPGPPPEPSDVERMRESIRKLESQVVALEERESALESRNNVEYVHDDASNQEAQEPLPGEERQEPQQVPQDQRLQGGERTEEDLLPEVEELDEENAGS